MKYGHSVGPTLRKTVQSQGPDGGLYSGEIMGSNVNRPVVINDEEIEHGIARLSSHGLYNLISERRDSGITNGDRIEWLQIMD